MYSININNTNTNENNSRDKEENPLGDLTAIIATIITAIVGAITIKKKQQKKDKSVKDDADS